MNSGLRFCMSAITPSRQSSVLSAVRCICASKAIAFLRPSCAAARNVRFVSAIAMGARVADVHVRLDAFLDYVRQARVDLAGGER